MPPVPACWQGACESGVEFKSSHCNKKLFGACSFIKGVKQGVFNISKPDDYDSPRDYEGHGTRTSSTAAGRHVPFANYFGYANGTAIAVAPASDTLAGMDQAIEDGVDLMSLSLGFIEMPFYENPIALGAFAAMGKGIFVSCSAGNGGPHAYAIHNGAPWITTVGSGTIDRDFAAHVTLGMYIFCDFNDQVSVFQQLYDMNSTGAAGAIFSSDSRQFLRPDDFNMPFVTVIPKPAPQVAVSSSRGPGRIAPWILKPDILAPGVDILAAWVPNRKGAPIRDDYLLTDNNIVSGISMASPHVVGRAALLKATHRDWSPAAI
ncbi:unnamed protein product [Ilex paraguariensis]|uniref:Peptidase S8/S53 domain-containing protein n=1 Tax=Ilex paraguariensis TaxID=185542 RepID=A0ABC8UK03_9AQUA